jgi:acrylyl-CoA reductase (NADPH)
VVLTGWDVEEHWGGYAQKQRVDPERLVLLPEGLDANGAMALGTTGFTAMLCVLRLEEDGIIPESGTVLVTGASEGVGSVAVCVLSALGYEVAALTSFEQEQTQDYLRSLVASEVVSGPEWFEEPKPLGLLNPAGIVHSMVTGGVRSRSWRLLALSTRVPLSLYALRGQRYSRHAARAPLGAPPVSAL